ncbi:NAD(P)H-hydrate epimerase [Chromohalobacter marismortui]|uniref:Bifunctional NAD(P)H-hydrate repair enzyme n=1 Tax=Chromohalobacter marismortui TaxID=42055 RepID=A0A4R7NUI7_9GAMM|nr:MULTISPECIES: NAD(P)H-hydrate dehydratase [Chromohalobacter]MCI0510640.1 NAD(P)H-hydrate dehydratase [Chromohalobacter sp.]MCI0591955.1 NAD(P)H-hydrate dehydratase [Chromohalobacter sp.]TDU24783.1 NAD(P)H-hydrate epimerase [Chromohalobacter marismortui]
MTTTCRVPHPLYGAGQVQALDRRLTDAGMAGFELMQRAAQAAYTALRSRWPEAHRLSILCGGGNNAGDGYVMAALAAADGLDVQLVALRDPATLSGDAARAHEMAWQAGLDVIEWRPETVINGDVTVDALLGTGATGEVREPLRSAIEMLNAAPRPVLAVDVPSGLSAQTGSVAGVAVRASLTVTFIADKFGLHTGASADHVGELHVETLGVTPQAHDDLVPLGELQTAEMLQRALPPRPRGSHKGDFGHVLVIGGGAGFGGAALMASDAALRSGAGKVSLATAAAHVAASLVRSPEVMARGVEDAKEIRELLGQASALVVGPGLGRQAWGHALWQAALEAGGPSVLDADALNWLAEEAPRRRDDWVLTPHPGEAARLLGVSSAEVQTDRRAAALALHERYGGSVVLKGAGTLIADADGVAVCPYGNPGMASGGMGDVLSGIVGALLAQGQTPGDAARHGVLMHALAGDAAARDGGERGLVATDLASYVRAIANPRPFEAMR